METNTTVSSIKAVILVTGAVLILFVAGLTIGLLIAAIGSLFYIALVFPLVMGVAGGNSLVAAMRLAKFRKANLLIAASVLTAVLIYGAYHYGRYVVLQVQMSIEIFSELSAATGPENLKAAKVVMDYALEQETGQTGFVGYMLFKAREGVSIGRFYSQNRLHMGSVLTGLYWLLEFGIIFWVVLSMGRRQAHVPFCESCGRQYAREKHLGGTIPANEPLLLSFLQQKDFLELGKLLERNADLPSTELYMQACEACKEGISHLTIRRAFRSSTGSLRFTDVSKVTLQRRESRLFLEQLRLEVADLRNEVITI